MARTSDKSPFWSFVVKRTLTLIPQLFIVATVAFVLIRLIPGDPVANMLGGTASEEAIAELRATYGLDQPVLAQYGDFLGGMLRGDLGVSWRTSQPVTTDVLARFPVTLQLITLAMLISLVVAVLGGSFLASAPKRGPASRLARAITRGYGLLAGAVPEFWLGILLVLLFYVGLNIAPAPFGLVSGGLPVPDGPSGFILLDALVHGEVRTFGSAVAHLVLPVTALALVTIGPLLRMTSSEMEKSLNSDYSRFSLASGLGQRRVYMNALQSSAAPILTLAGYQYSLLIGGAVLIEKIFSLGGFGQYGVDSVLASDYPAVLGFVTVAGALAFVVYLLLDILQAALDPRVR